MSFEDEGATFAETARRQLGSGDSSDDAPLAAPGGTKGATPVTGPTKGVQRRVALVPVPPQAATSAEPGRPVGEGETKEDEGEVEPAKDRTGETATAEEGGRAPGEWVKNAVMEWVW